jgi:hypothetical protein
MLDEALMNPIHEMRHLVVPIVAKVSKFTYQTGLTVIKFPELPAVNRYGVVRRLFERKR